MDKKMVVGWIVGIVARGLAWIFAAKLGWDATASQDAAQQVGSAVGALILVGISVWSSISGRKKLKASPPA